MTINATFLPSIDEICGAVTDEITALGGSTSDLVRDQDHLFMRVVLPASAEIRLGDSMQAGVAVRALPEQIDVHPYTFRQVCTNGAIVTNALPGQQIERVQAVDVGTSYDAEVVLSALRDAVRQCASPKAFDIAVSHMQAMTNEAESRALSVLVRLARMHARDAMSHLPMIYRRFAASDDRSAFGLMNAVTSVARDTEDPALRWSLETIGGSMPAYLARRSRVTRPAAALENTEVDVLV